ncbi:DUF2514 family protein [Xylophilus sp. Leaf220]|uniref:DUF2514 family protein n=1 Tax=Xylophilus sp. Leaf220 TaxID=1735686 RepID=UPI0006F9A3B0|nr:DUF2514 family protein [Xylophilus sp. Leaf220]KQM79806.1 hypothetical protein ASE76_00965 [Xylophilus sp. Leaf220]
MLSLIPAPYRWAALALAVAALAGGSYRAGVSREHDRGTVALAQLQSRWDAADAAARGRALTEAEQNARETQRRLDRQKENDDAQAAQLARAARDLVDARTAGQRLHQQSEALRAAIRGAAGDPAAGSSSAPAGDALDLFADLFSRADGRAGELAEALDRSYAAGLRCELDYISLNN